MWWGTVEILFPMTYLVFNTATGTCLAGGAYLCVSKSWSLSLAWFVLPALCDLDGMCYHASDCDSFGEGCFSWWIDYVACLYQMVSLQLFSSFCERFCLLCCIEQGCLAGCFLDHCQPHASSGLAVGISHCSLLMNISLHAHFVSQMSL